MMLESSMPKLLVMCCSRFSLINEILIWYQQLYTHTINVSLIIYVLSYIIRLKNIFVFYSNLDYLF